MLDKCVHHRANTQRDKQLFVFRETLQSCHLALCAYLQAAGEAAVPGQNPHRHWENTQAPLGWTGTHPAVTPPAFRFLLTSIHGVLI